METFVGLPQKTPNILIRKTTQNITYRPSVANANYVQQSAPQYLFRQGFVNRLQKLSFVQIMNPFTDNCTEVYIAQ